jgi:NAD(P)H dehydrogenase (quinone)
LKGKTARLIVTMDTPAWWNRFIYRAAGHNAMTHATLHFCGIRPVRITNLAGMRKSTAEQRAKWLEKIQTLGARDSARVKQKSLSTSSIQHSS